MGGSPREESSKTKDGKHEWTDRNIREPAKEIHQPNGKASSTGKEKMKGKKSLKK